MRLNKRSQALKINGHAYTPIALSWRDNWQRIIYITNINFFYLELINIEKMIYAP